MEQSTLDALKYPFDSAKLMRSQRRLRKSLRADGSTRTPKRIAVLGGSTTEKVVDLLDLFLLGDGLDVEFYQCDYARFWEESVFDNPALREFGPDLIIVHTSVRNLRVINSWVPDADVLEDMLSADKERFQKVWDSLSANYACPIIQNNFERPPYRMLGSNDIADKRGISSYIMRINEFLYEYAGRNPNLFVHDIDYLSARIGLRDWHDADSWCLYKSAFAIAVTPDYSYSLSRIIKAIFGLNKKAIVLDLDNTLWKGVVGDDGVEGINMGTETAVGEKHHQLQEYLRHFPQIGVILAVNSKNDRENALEGLKREDSLLPPESFASIQANWNPKSENMKLLAEELNLGLDSFVFIDDNPAERDIVRMSVPSVTCVDFDDIGQVVSRIDDAGYFEVVSLTADDAKRAAMYLENASRRALEVSSDNYDDYLDALEMVGEVNGFEPQYLPRVAQLTNKTNQFNLTTKRCTEADIASYAQDEHYACLSLRLSDKYGDNGLISVLLGECDDDAVMHVRLWLMSCRVLKRGVEQFAFNALAQAAIDKGARTIRGYYFPTKKNGMVRNLYGELGFDKVSEDDAGNAVWEFDLADFEQLPTHIALKA